ncbi:hypothetical protein [Glycomyces tenuis]|uniref:hypothetical protein n=1 Tax=Glycomyces tenuis TaxID=58116 RepID=UPI0003FC862E|nr:hypothetical protein [Glycomyces tenuis]
MDAYERDMITALASGKGAEFGANRQFLRRVVAEKTSCPTHNQMLVLDETVAVEMVGTATGRRWCLVICASAFEMPHRQRALQEAMASPHLEVTVYDGRDLFDPAQSAPETDSDREGARHD